MSEKSPDQILANALESSRTVKLGRGVVSKTGYVAALVIAVWFAIAWRWSGNWPADAGLLFLGMASTGFGAWYIRATQSFAEKNPAQALLEGAEFLEWTRMEAAAKGLPPVANPLMLDIKPAEEQGDG